MLPLSPASHRSDFYLQTIHVQTYDLLSDAEFHPLYAGELVRVLERSIQRVDVVKNVCENW